MYEFFIKMPTTTRFLFYIMSICVLILSQMFHKFTQGNGAFDKVTAATSRIGKSANETTLQVRSKTVAQCVEFYYTYKKQVKVGRNGILTFGPPDSPEEKHQEAVVDVKSSQQSKLADGDDKKEVSSYEQSHESSQQARVAQSLQAHDYAGTMVMMKEPVTVNKVHHPAPAHRPRAEPAAKKSKAPVKPPQDPDAIFPCKKCGRVFYKVKSRSAHMKSHAEQEKKAAALRQKEEEEKAAAEAQARKAAAATVAAAAAVHQRGNGNGVTEQAEGSSQEDSSEVEDDDDEDWH